jgi:GntR family transcriptional regulator
VPDAQFRRIAADIHRRIQAGEWAVGEALPSRVEMAAEYRVHPQTMRLAHRHLRSLGILEGEPRKRVFVAHPPAMRTLTNADAPWPFSSETTDTRPAPASEELAARLIVPAGVQLQHETIECMDPGGRSAMLISSWWRGRRRQHSSYSAELGVTPLAENQAHALGLLVDTVAFRVVRTRFDHDGRPLETADLILPMDRWLIRLASVRP